MNFHSPHNLPCFCISHASPSLPISFFSHSPLFSPPVYRYLQSVSLRHSFSLLYVFVGPRMPSHCAFSLSRLLLFHLCRARPPPPPPIFRYHFKPSRGFTDNDNGKKISFHELSTSTHFLHFSPLLFRIRGYHAFTGGSGNVPSHLTPITGVLFRRGINLSKTFPFPRISRYIVFNNWISSSEPIVSDFSRINPKMGARDRET